MLPAFQIGERLADELPRDGRGLDDDTALIGGEPDREKLAGEPPVLIHRVNARRGCEHAPAGQVRILNWMDGTTGGGMKAIAY